MKGRIWAYVGLGLGGAVSILGNVLHTFVPPAGAGPDWTPEGPAVAAAAFWPIALYVAIEIIARTDWRAGWQWLALRWVSASPVALVAAVVSYQHLSGLLKHWGEAELTWRFGPVAVDGLIVLATGALIGAVVQARTTTDPDPGMAETGPGASGPAPVAVVADPHEAATEQATVLLAEVAEYLASEAERLEVEHLAAQALADREAARITERAALVAERDAERDARRADRAAWWPRLVALLGVSGARAYDDEIRQWLADEAEHRGAVPSRADVREFFGTAPGNTRLDELRREVIQARAGERSEPVPEAAGR